MGIKGLGRFLAEQAPGSVRQLVSSLELSCSTFVISKDIGALMGRIVAIDASLSLYQFMIAIRDGENFG